MESVTLIAWSDYLCPWCFNASVRLHRLEDELAGRLRIEWRSYLLRPDPVPGRDLERFRAYTASWRRPAAEADAGSFTPWHGDAGPPTHSVPAHQLAKAAAGVGPGAFRRMHERLLEAYFRESRDVSDRDTQRQLWLELGLPEAELARRDDPELLARIRAEHASALEAGATGVPALQMQGNPAVIVGANPLELYRRWVMRALEGKVPGAVVTA